MGAVAGRCANRIAGGRFSLDGKSYQLPLNEQGVTHLHGGHMGFGRRVWTVEMASETRVVLSIESPDGEEGYPGHVRARCVYTLTPEGVLSIALTADTTAPTLVNLATHSYFNLAGSQTILDHTLTLAAEHYTPVDERLIPTGEVAAVAGTGYDFRTAARIGEQRAKNSERLRSQLCCRRRPIGRSPVRRPARLAGRRSRAGHLVHRARRAVLRRAISAGGGAFPWPPQRQARRLLPGAAAFPRCHQPSGLSKRSVEAGRDLSADNGISVYVVNADW